MKIKNILFLIMLLLLLCCADIKDFDNPLSDGELTFSSGTFVLYNDRLHTGGGIVLDKGWDNQEFDDVYDNPYYGNRCLKYTWNGKHVKDNDGNKYKWCQLYFLVSKDWDTYRTISIIEGRYNKLEFYARGKISEDTTVTFAGPTGQSTGALTSLSSKWKKYTVELDTASLASIWNYFSIVFSYDDGGDPDKLGSGGTVYLDEIKLTR